MLRGNALAKVDDKGRLKLPSAYRSIVLPRYGRELFVTSIRGDCALIYPLEVYAATEELLQGSSRVQPVVSRLCIAFNYYGQTATMDAQGRVLIHPLLREKADIDGEVAVIGQHDHLVVWNLKRVRQAVEDAPLTDEDLKELATLGI